MSYLRPQLRQLAMSAVVASQAAALAAVTPAIAQLPDPSDIATLYEKAKVEGTIRWYVGSPLPALKALLAEFEKKYPGIKVELNRGAGVAQYQKFMQETLAGQHIADMVQIADFPSVRALHKDGHLAEWKVPTADRFEPKYRMGYAAYLPQPTDNAIAYNVNKLTPEEVEILSKSWNSVLDPRFKGRFAVVTMKCGTCYAPLQMFADPKLSAEFGPDFAAKVAAQKPAMYSDTFVALERVVAGEHDFTYWTFEAAATTMWSQGAPIRWVMPPNTPSFTNTWYAISKYAPHPHAARLLLTWILSEEGAYTLQRTQGARTTLQGAEDRRPVAKEKWYRPLTKAYDIDFDVWQRDYNKSLEAWIKTMRAGQ